jgi:TRAP-type C4-dicarboxylate transport system substrate-binding protein
MKRRTFVSAAGAATLGGVLPASAQTAQNWTLYHHQSAPQFTTSLGAKRFADNIERETAGAIKVRLHLAGTLQINSANLTTAVGQNVVTLGDDFFFAGNVPIAALMRLPFFATSYEDIAKVGTVLQPYVDKAYESKGAVVLASYAYPNQYIWSRKEITSLAALKGAKIRVASPEQAEFMRRFGATPVTIGPAEVPSALDRGVVDGLVTGTVGADLWQDMLRFGYLLGLNFNNSYLIANAGAYRKLSPDMQAKVRQAAVEAARWNEDTMRQDDGGLVQKLGASKLKIAQPTPAEVQEASNSIRGYWDEWAKQRGGEAPEALAKARQALGR